MNTKTKKKSKRLTKEQKANIYDTLDSEGFFVALTEGYLDTDVKGTSLAKAVKEAKKAFKALEAKLTANGINDADFINGLKDELEVEAEAEAQGRQAVLDAAEAAATGV